MRSADQCLMEKHGPIRIEMKQFSQLIILAILFVLILFAFQNCGAPIGESDELSSVASSSPYPYNAKMDQVAFMSCSGMSNYDNNAYFSYRLQAKNSGSGLKLNSDFVSRTGGYNASKRSQVIQLHDHVIEGHLQTSIRMISDYQSIYNFGAGENYDFSNYSLALDSSEVADTMAGKVNGEYVNSFSAPIQMDLDFLTGSKIRTMNEQIEAGNGFLSASFAPKDSYRAAGPSGISSSTSIYGQGLIPGFSRPSHLSSGAKNIMTSLSEFDPSNNKLLGNWTCPSSLRFVIVRNSDRGADYDCRQVADANNSTVAKLREILPASDWYIDYTRKCVMAKNEVNSCYGVKTGTVDIAYPGNPATTCDPALNNCPHYVSVCYKN